jgi:hypothetical protein
MEDINGMNAIDLDQTEEGTLTDEVSDEVLGVAAGALSPE